MVMLMVKIAVVGFVAWLLTQIPMKEPFKIGIYVLAVIFVIFILVGEFGDIPLR